MARKTTTKNKAASTNKMATPKKKAATKTKSVFTLVSLKTVTFAVLALTITSAAIVYMLNGQAYQPSTDLMPIRVVKIEGELKYLSREQIIEQLLNESGTEITEQNKVEGSGYIGFLGSDLQLLEQRLEWIPWLQKAELRRIWPDRIHIKVQEQKAIARWNDDDLINKFGEIFTPETIKGFEHLPLLTGPDHELKNMLQTFKELQQLLTTVELQLEVLNLNHRYSWSLELANGIQLQVGRTDLIDRVERFIALYPLLRRESELPITKVDLRYDTGLAVTRLETSELQASL